MGRIGQLMVAELARVGLDADLDWGSLFASDLAGRARAYKELRDANMDDTRAREVCGL